MALRQQLPQHLHHELIRDARTRSFFATENRTKEVTHMAEILELQELEEETLSLWPCVNSYHSTFGMG